MNDNQDHFNVLRKIKNKPDSTQRELAEELGFSLGKLNYCLKALKNKGLVKMKNFGKNPTIDSNSYAQLLIVMILEQFEVTVPFHEPPSRKNVSFFPIQTRHSVL